MNLKFSTDSVDFALLNGLKNGLLSTLRFHENPISMIDQNLIELVCKFYEYLK